MAELIVIGGASGKLGSRVTSHLLKLVPPSSIRLAVRDPSKVTSFTSQGASVGEGDYSKPGFVDTLRGASKFLLVSAPAVGEEAVNLHRQAIEAAKEAGVRTIYYTSQISAQPGSKFSPSATSHVPTHEMLEKSGINHVILRNGYHADVLIRNCTPAKFTGEIAVPPDGKVAWVTHDDLAEAIAKILARPAPAKSEHVYLTNAEAIDYQEAAGIMSDILGKPITRREIGDEEFVSMVVQHGFTEPMAELFLSSYAAAKDGEFSKIDPTLEELLGRKPVSIKDILVKGEEVQPVSE